MEVRNWRRGRLSTTAIGFGGAPVGNYGVAVSDASAHEVLDAAWTGGVRYFDTAPLYGTGLSERRIGAFLLEKPRDSFVLSTKVGRLVRPNPKPTGGPVTEYGFHVPDDETLVWDFSAAGIRRSIEESLSRLGLDRIDIALIHDPDEHADEVLETAYPELEKLRAEGLLRAIGVGMNQWQMPLRFVQETDIDVVMLAGRFTLADQSGLPLLDACRERGVSVIAAAPFNSGLLSQNEVPESTTFNYLQAPSELIDSVRAISRICAAYGIDLPRAALCFPLLHPAVVSVVPGIRSLADAKGAVSALTAPIPADLWRELADASLVHMPAMAASR